MKRINIISSVVLTLLLLTSCESFLQPEMEGQYTSDSYFISEENAVMAVNGIYNSLYNSKLWVFGDVASDDAVKGGNAGDQADINAIDDFSATSDNGMISTFWQATYETIARANNSINNIPSIQMDDSLKNRLTGEAKFIRAYSYFNLVNIFGKVPLKLLPQNSEEAVYVGLSEVTDIYDQIETDLKFAASTLPVSYSIEKGRASKGAALALLARTYLYQAKYSDCITTIQSLESIGLYALESNYADLFKAGAENSREVIFGLRYINNDEVSMGNLLNVWFAPSIEGGYYFDAPTQNYVDAFTDKTVSGDDDPRLDASIGRDGHPWFNGGTFSSSWSEATGYLVKKYNEDMAEGLAKSQSLIPLNLIRFADVILMKAEALNETTQTALAIAELNKIRNRAGLKPTDAATQTNLRVIIRNERRKELGFEFQRFFDLMRWGKDVATAALPDLPWENLRFYFPIPQSEADTNQAL